MLLKCIKKAVTLTSFIIIFVIISAGFVHAEDSITLTVTANILNFREAPDTSAKILDQFAEGEFLTAVDSSNGWYKIIKDGKTGWISGDYVITTDTQSNIQNNPQNNTQNNSGQSAIATGAITGYNVNFRKGPGLTYSVIKQLDKGDKLDILETTDEWFRVKASDGTTGWVSCLYIKAGSADSSGKASENARAETEISRGGFSRVTASDIIDYAESLLGVKYIYGGTSPETGFDCSGFTQYVFDRFGIRLERVAADQAKQGTEILQEDLKPGDLVFSDTDGGNNNINHVGIYIGDGKFISAASGSTTGKVVIQDLNSSYWQNTYMTARRII